mgnify:CR=1 FL=1
MLNTDRWGGLLLLVVAGLAWPATRSFSELGGIFPRAAAGAVAVFGAGLVAKSWLRPDRARLFERPAAGLAVGALVGAAAVYVALIPRLGFLAASGLMYAGVAWALGRERSARRAAGCVAVAALVTALFYAGFRYGFGVPLPAGTWWDGALP